MAIKRFIKKPSVPSLTGWPDWAHGVMNPIKQTLEIITGRRGEKLEQLSGEVELDAVAEKINEVIRVLQDGQDVDVSGAASVAPTPQVTVNNITQTVIQEIGGSSSGPSYWTPADLDGVALWLDASDNASITLTGGAVSAWADKSGNDRHATQSTAGARPVVAANAIGAQQAIRFDGTDDVLSFGEITTVAAVFMLARWTAETGNYRPLLGHPTLGHFQGAFAGNLSGSSYDYRLIDTDNALSAVVQAIRYSTGRPITGVGTRTTDWQIIEFVLASSATVSNLASDRGLSGRVFFGDVAELVIVDRSNAALLDGNGRLLDVHRQKIEGYMAWKWGLQNQLPERHPYRFVGTEFGHNTESIFPVLPDFIVNGSMEVRQRPATGTTVDSVVSGINGRVVTADRFYAHVDDFSRPITLTHNSTSMADAPELFGRRERRALSITGTTFGAGGYGAFLYHTIKHADFIPWQNRSFSVQFGVRASVTGTYALVFMAGTEATNNRIQHFQTYTINAADVWEEKIVTFPPRPPFWWRYTQDISLVWVVRANNLFSGSPIWQYAGRSPISVTQANPLTSSSNNWQLAGVRVVGARALGPAETAAECARFYRRSAISGNNPEDASGAVYEGGYNPDATGDVRLRIDFGRAMAARPLVTTYRPTISTRGQLNRLADNTAITGLNRVTAASENHHSWLVSMSGQTNHGVSFCWEADAEPTP